MNDDICNAVDPDDDMFGRRALQLWDRYRYSSDAPPLPPQFAGHVGFIVHAALSRIKTPERFARETATSLLALRLHLDEARRRDGVRDDLPVLVVVRGLLDCLVEGLWRRKAKRDRYGR